MVRYIKWLGILAAVLMIIACFLPWTYHPDIDTVFTGFYSEKNTYGKPGKFLVSFAILIAAGYLIPRIWIKRTNLFISSINFAYALKTFLLFSSCYSGFCPEKKTGLWIMIVTAAAMLVAALFPDMKIGGKEGNGNGP